MHGHTLRQADQGAFKLINLVANNEPVKVKVLDQLSKSNEKQLRSSFTSREFFFNQLPTETQFQPKLIKANNGLKARMVKKNKQTVAYKVNNPEPVRIKNYHSRNMIIRDDDSGQSRFLNKGAQVEFESPGFESRLKDANN